MLTHIKHHRAVHSFVPLQKLFFILFFLITFSKAYAQPGGPGDPVPDPGQVCNTPSCITPSINISTGYNQSTGTYQSPVSFETNWQLVAVPAGVSITVPGPSYVIAPLPGAWSTFPNAQWVSPFTTWQYQVNNDPLQGGTPFTFKKCFCLCEATNVHFKYTLLADDWGVTSVDGRELANGIGATSSSPANYGLPGLEVDTVLFLAAGEHCLTVDLYNVGMAGFGFAVEGSVSASGLLKPLCCNAKGNLCGKKLKDADCNGIVDPDADAGVAGFQIRLYDFGGNLIGTTTTDASGGYCFMDLTPGTYVVEEVNQPGWTQTYPASGIHTIVVPPAGTAYANFGNCPPSCSSLPDPAFIAKVENCMVAFDAVLGTIPYGYQLVSSTWTFGDGYSSNELNPTHAYTDIGEYTVCLKVVYFNEDGCCIREFCDKVVIDNKCEGSCLIEGKIIANFDPYHCTYHFEGVVTNTTTPVTAWYWEFGDGNTGNGSTVTYSYPVRDVYTVCVYMFGGSAEDCCYGKICETIEIPSCYHNEGAQRTMATPVNMGKAENMKEQLQTEQRTIKSKAPSGDQSMIILDQNVPNPFAESTVITYNIPVSFKKAQIVFVNKSGKTVKVHDVQTKGEGKLQVFGDDLSTGLYSYSLIVDGKVIETKSMLKH